jgi:endonuclease/exonuclease/phosphatase family metal-dependent hydrolase
MAAWLHGPASMVLGAPLLGAPFRGLARLMLRPREICEHGDVAATDALGTGASVDFLRERDPGLFAFSEAEDGWCAFELGQGAKASAAGDRDSAAEDSGGAFRVLTWNVLMDEFNEHVPGVIHTSSRHKYIVHLVTTECPELICFNEVDADFLARLCQNEVVRERYLLTDCAAEECSAGSVHRAVAGETLGRDWGNVILLRKDFPALTGFSTHLIKGEIGRVDSVVLSLHLGDKRLAVISAHLQSRAENSHIRRSELELIFSALSLPAQQAESQDFPEGVALVPKPDQILLLGDLNMHSEHENVLFDGTLFHDVWLKLGNLPQDGVTWDGQGNSLIQRMYCGIDDRRMRLDRLWLSADDGGVVQPSRIEIFGRALVPDDFLDPGLLDRPRYLTPSDHYGLMTTLVPKNSD